VAKVVLATAVTASWTNARVKLEIAYSQRTVKTPTLAAWTALKIAQAESIAASFVEK
jgi:hypothetical protein